MYKSNTHLCYHGRLYNAAKMAAVTSGEDFLVSIEEKGRGILFSYLISISYRHEIRAKNVNRCAVLNINRRILKSIS